MNKWQTFTFEFDESHNSNISVVSWMTIEWILCLINLSVVIKGGIILAPSLSCVCDGAQRDGRHAAIFASRETTSLASRICRIRHLLMHWFSSQNSLDILPRCIYIYIFIYRDMYLLTILVRSSWTNRSPGPLGTVSSLRKVFKCVRPLKWYRSGVHFWVSSLFVFASVARSVIATNRSEHHSVNEARHSQP